MTTARLVVNVLFAAILTVLVDIAGEYALSICFSQSAMFPSNPPLLASDLIAYLEYATGGFLLGTLERKRNPLYLTTLLYIAAMNFASPAFSLLSGQASLSSVVTAIFGVAFAVAAGQCTKYSWRNSALNIPNYHWLWLIPTSLFQTVCVPLTLFFAFFAVHANGVVPNGDFIFRAGLTVLLPLFAFLILNAYKILSSRKKLSVKDKLSLVGTWLVLTIAQIFLVAQIGLDYA